MNTNDRLLRFVALGLIAGAAIGILVATLLPDKVPLALAMVAGAALGLVVGAVMGQSGRRSG